MLFRSDSGELVSDLPFRDLFVAAGNRWGVPPQILASMAKAMGSESYMNVARAAIQLRGGIGFTWEDNTHLWFKRAKSSEVFMGTPSYHRDRMLDHLREAS